MAFSFPVVGTSLHEQRDGYGDSRGGGSRSHKGLDIFAPKGAPVVAVSGGTVVKSGDSGGLSGIRVWIEDDQGYFHFYAHLDSFNVKAGQKIEAGQQLGTVGNTGREAVNTDHHLHYSVNKTGATGEHGNINPYEFLRSNGASVAMTHGFEEGARTKPGTPVGMTPASDEYAPIVDPAQQFVDERRASSDTMASIMGFVSKATAGEDTGRLLDTKALLGDFSPQSFDEDEVA